MSAIIQQIKKVKTFSWLLYPLLYNSQIEAPFDFDTNLLSPFREEKHPSFKVYSNSYRFEDFKRHKGDIIDFYSLLNNCSNVLAIHNLYTILMTGSYQPVNPSLLQKESKDFSLEVWHKPKLDKPTLDYYAAWDITEKTLVNYNVKSVGYYSVNNQKRKAERLVIDMPLLGRSKLLQPYAADKKYKWCSTYKQDFIEGFIPVKNRNKSNPFTKDICIITKALKECMFYAEHYQIDAFAAPSEKTLLSSEFIQLLKTKYKKVIVALDNDETGKESAYAYKLKYDLPFIFFPAKNITDFYEIHKSKEILYSLLNTL